ncbi:MAG: ABC transporter permease [Planctomycetota bacterium]|jgi:lipoprotein-releasing system permease protein
MLRLFLCLRYLRKVKIVFLSVAAVALSVSLLIVVSSLFSGFIKTFQQAAVDVIGDVVLSPRRPFKVQKYPLLIEQLEQATTVRAATAALLAPGLLKLDTGIVRPVEVWGIQPDRLARVTGFKQALLKQEGLPGEPSFETGESPAKTGGFVGIGVLGEPDDETDEYDLEAVGKWLGKQVVLTTGTASGTEIKRKVVAFSIADVVETGVYQFDKGGVYLSIEDIQRTLYRDQESPIADQILIKLNDDVDTEVALAEITGLWRNFVAEHLEANLFLMRETDILTAKEMQKPYVRAYRKQMGILLLIFGIVSFGVVLLVFCIFYMIVRLKQKDIAIIRSCGTSSTAVAMVFVDFGACVGILGSAIGALLGHLITTNINIIEGWIRIVFGLKLWKSSVYMFSKIPNEVDWLWALVFMLVATAAAVVGTLIPAVVAARTKPVNILQYE